MLEGLRIIEYATYVAAPGATGILRDWGADVIKIEPLEGDPIRQFFQTIGSDVEDNPVFDMDNRGKKSIAIDTRKSQGADLVRTFAKTADVFVTNLRQPSLKRSQLDYQTLKGINSRLVYASVSGYGLTGPDADRPGFDMAAFWSRSGLANLSVPKGAEPLPLRTAFGDHITSLATAGGILAAVVEQQRSGKGSLVEASLLRTGIYTMASDYAIHMRLGRVASTRPRERAVNPIANYFKTADDVWLCLLPRQGNADWPKYADVIGRPELKDDKRFATSKARRINRDDLLGILDAAFAQEDAAHWAQKFDEMDLAWAPVQTPAEVISDPQAAAAGAFIDVPKADGTGTQRAPASPIRFDGQDEQPATATPEIGEHTDEILEEYGIDPEPLRTAGIIA